MAIKLQEIEASGTRWEAASTDYPQGKFINGSGSGKRDGSYCHASWANDIFGFLGAILHNANVTPNGTVETARNSQIYTALTSVIDSLVSKSGIRYDKNQGLTTGEKLVARENSASVGYESQSLTTAQQKQARTNIDAQSASELTTALSELIKEYGVTVPS